MGRVMSSGVGGAGIGGSPPPSSGDSNKPKKEVPEQGSVRNLIGRIGASIPMGPPKKIKAEVEMPKETTQDPATKPRRARLPTPDEAKLKMPQDLPPRLETYIGPPPSRGLPLIPQPDIGPPPSRGVPSIPKPDKPVIEIRSLPSAPQPAGKLSTPSNPLGAISSVDRLILDFEDSLIEAVEKKPNAKVLILNECDYSNGEFGAIEKLPHLIILKLNDVTINKNDLQSLERLLGLRELRLNKVKAPISAIGGLINLNKLEIVDSPIMYKEFEIFGKLTNLTSLDLTGCKSRSYGLQSFAAINSHPATGERLPLREFIIKTQGNAYIYDNNDGDSFESFKTLVHLESLKLNNCNVMDDDLQHFSGFKDLVSLDVGSTIFLGGHGFKYLTGLENLRSINLSHCKNLTNDALLYVKELKNLTSLNLAFSGGDRISSEGFKYLEELTHLEYLSLSMTRFGDGDCQALQKMTNLKELNLTGCEITDKGLEIVGEMKSLERLSINTPNLTDDGLQKLKNLTNLKTLWIKSGMFSKEAIDALKVALPNLEIKELIL